MNVGFTGTQAGMTDKQKAQLAKLLVELSGEEFHHGDCVGADAEAQAIALRCGYALYVHPPENPSKRAFCKVGEILKPKPYLARNHDIVDATDILIAAPQSNVEVVRSGTWATVRYARKKNRKIHIVQV